jgi:hypothetical protein
VKCTGDRCEAPVRIFENVVVPEAEDPVSFRFDDARSCLILGATMLATIALDDQLGPVTRKISNEGPDRNLIAKMLLREVLAEKPPQPLLSVGCFSPKSTGSSGASLWRTIVNHLLGLPGSPHP